jgi:flagellar protein FliO/FliZ
VLDFLFGEGQYGLRFLFAFIVVLGLIGLTAWLVRRFGATHLGATAARGRQPRLAVIDAAAVDGRRRLVLIRRDNVEHLLMIGGPSDVVIEPNIVRAASAREKVSTSQPAAANTLPRPVPLGEPDDWPEPAPAPQSAPRRGASHAIEEPQVPWPAEPEPQQMPRQARVHDPLAGLAAELTRNPPEPAPALAMPRVVRGAREPTREPIREPVREPMRDSVREPPREAPREVPREHPREVAREPAREPIREVVREPIREVAREPMREQMREPMREVMREPMREVVREPIREVVREPMREVMREAAREPLRAQQQAAPEVPFASSADQNLAEMAQRLEAALRRPVGKAEARPEAKPRAVPEPAPMAEPSPLEPPVDARREAKPAPQRSPYDSLEQEMASLLGRPGSKA